MTDFLLRNTDFKGGIKMKNEKTKNWHDLSGKLWFSMTNDYLFRALMQEHRDSLKELVAALLGWSSEDIRTVTVENPIVLGESISAKDFMLDVRVCLNDYHTLNLEMQVLNESNWPDRSLSYLCRLFDKLFKGQNYTEAKPSHQIGITSFSPFEDREDFYATYMLLNTKSYKRYTDKFSISVLDLTKVDNATREDKERGLDKWARMYRCTTWEELKELAADNPAIEKAVGYMYMMSEEERIREQMEYREEFLIREKMKQAQMEKYERDLKVIKGNLKEARGDLEQTRGDLEQTREDLAKAQAEISSLRAENARLKGQESQ